LNPEKLSIKNDNKFFFFSSFIWFCCRRCNTKLFTEVSGDLVFRVNRGDHDIDKKLAPEREICFGNGDQEFGIFLLKDTSQE